MTIINGGIVTGKTGDWEMVIGLEIHAQIKSESKLFSSSAASFGAEPNSQVSFVDAAFPGMLPVLNGFCVEQAVKTGIGIEGKVNLYSQFDRKNYFYPDLPQGYQITQFYHPIVQDGRLEIETGESNSGKKTIRINRIHIEQDAGKSIHDQSPDCSFIDLNRSGVGLMEIVSEPDISSPEEAANYIKKLRSILRYLDTCDGDMEKGSFRCDANVSVRKAGDELGTRCEIKNLNSIKHIIKAIEFEAARQVEILESGGKVDQQTRLYDPEEDQTRLMRSKEDALDYCYFPDPDLLPLVLEQDFVDQIRKNMPELPEAKKNRYISEYGLPEYDASVITADKDTADYFDIIVKNNNPRVAANWLCAELFGRMNKSNIEINECKVTPEDFSAMLNLMEQNVISGKIAKQVLDIMFETGEKPEEIIKKHNLIQVTDVSAIEKIIDQVLAEASDKVAEYKSGKEKMFGFFVGQVMKLSGGKANPQIVNDLLLKKLS
jgi:aspartyl-tRNA(Asn)/glutamyl-tRNA(Gln) amidotransferase subunit B